MQGHPAPQTPTQLPSWAASVQAILAREGAMQPGDVFKIAITRSDLNVTREGVPLIYSDGYNKSPSDGGVPFPRHANAPYLGEFGDNKMPDLAWLHHQLARGGSRSLWPDSARR